MMMGGVSIASNTKVLGNQLKGVPPLFFHKNHNRLSTFMYIAGIGSIEPKMGVPGGWGSTAGELIRGAHQ